MIAILTYSRVAAKVIMSGKQTHAAIYICQALDSGLKRLDLTPGGGGTTGRFCMLAHIAGEISLKLMVLTVTVFLLESDAVATIVPICYGSRNVTQDSRLIIYVRNGKPSPRALPFQDPSTMRMCV